MLSERTLRKKARDIGYSIHKGLKRYMSDNYIVEPKELGYMVMDNSGYYVWGSYNNVFTHLWDIRDVSDFLQSEYERLGLKF